MKHPLIHVLIINWNGIEHLNECFSTLLANDYPNARYVLLDNGSTDGSVDLVQDTFRDDRVSIVALGANLGWSGANNAGIEKAMDAGADYVALWNNDTATAPDAIEKLVACAEARPEAGALAPKMLLYDHPSLLNSLGLECSIIGCGWDRGIGRLNQPKWDVIESAAGACGGACLYRVETLRETGLLSTDYNMYLDDLELGLRMWNAGWKVLTCPESVVRHKFSATMRHGAQARRKYFLSTRNRAKLMLRMYPKEERAAILAKTILGECKAVGRAILDGEFWRLGPHVRTWLGLPREMRLARKRRSEDLTRGLVPGTFWPLVKQDMLFFPGVELPVDGWYAERKIEKELFRPISGSARCDKPKGTLRIACGNPYPALGDTHVDLRLEGQLLATLQTNKRQETELEFPGGRLELVARRIFDADETRERIDIGGWFRFLD